MLKIFNEGYCGFKIEKICFTESPGNELKRFVPR